MVNPVTYLQSVFTEMKKVSWPTFPTLVKYFFSVVIGVALATVVIGALDLVFVRSLSLIIN